MEFLTKIFRKKLENPITVNSTIFQKSIAQGFAKKLRQDGWKGSGFHFRRTKENNITELVSFFPSRYGGEFYVEIGIHFDFIPLDKFVDPKKINTSNIDIRRRMGNPKNELNNWEYPKTERGLLQLNQELLNSFQSDGEKFFNLFSNWEIELLSIRPEDRQIKKSNIPFPPEIRTARILSFLNLHQKKYKVAKEFAEYGLSKINGPNGKSLEKDFLKILNQCQ